MPRDIKFLKADLDRYIQSVVTKQMLKEFGEQMRDIIFNRVKAGKGLSSKKVSVGGNSLQKLKDLSESYIDFRRKHPPRGEFASARRSNLTYTGELLDAIIVKVRGESVTVEIENRAHSSGQTTREVAKKVADGGRPFFGLSDSEVKILDNFVKRRIRQEVRKLKS